MSINKCLRNQNGHGLRPSFIGFFKRSERWLSALRCAPLGSVPEILGSTPATADSNKYTGGKGVLQWAFMSLGSTDLHNFKGLSCSQPVQQKQQQLTSIIFKVHLVVGCKSIRNVRKFCKCIDNNNNLLGEA